MTGGALTLGSGSPTAWSIGVPMGQVPAGPLESPATSGPLFWISKNWVTGDKIGDRIGLNFGGLVANSFAMTHA